MPRTLKQLEDDPQLVEKYAEAFSREDHLKTVPRLSFTASAWI